MYRKREMLTMHMLSCAAHASAGSYTTEMRYSRWQLEAHGLWLWFAVILSKRPSSESSSEALKKSRSEAETKAPKSAHPLRVCVLSSGSRHEVRSTCPYLDTINRKVSAISFIQRLTERLQVLDFDFEKLCSISLSNMNVYACLVCGKYFQGLLFPAIYCLLNRVSVQGVERTRTRTSTPSRRCIMCSSTCTMRGYAVIRHDVWWVSHGMT